jgi:threonine/homoserine/homoserine lactone efflux protein
VTTALLGFALASTLLILAPGPDSMLVIRNTMRGGRKAGWTTACGTMTGLAIWAVAAALGLSALVRVSHVGYDVLRFAGAAYLIWLGATSLGLFGRADTGRPDTGNTGTGHTGTGHTGTGHTGTGPTAERPPPGRATWARAYLNGVLSNLFNPKISVFFMAFLPAFIPAHAAATQFSLALGLWFIAETGLWLAVVAWLADRGARWLRRTAVQRWLERVTGIVLIGFGIRLATEAR